MLGVLSLMNSPCDVIKHDVCMAKTLKVKVRRRNTNEELTCKEIN